MIGVGLVFLIFTVVVFLIKKKSDIFQLTIFGSTLFFVTALSCIFILTSNHEQIHLVLGSEKKTEVKTSEAVSGENVGQTNYGERNAAKAGSYEKRSNSDIDSVPSSTAETSEQDMAINSSGKNDTFVIFVLFSLIGVFFTTLIRHLKRRDSAKKKNQAIPVIHWEEFLVALLAATGIVWFFADAHQGDPLNSHTLYFAFINGFGWKSGYDSVRLE